MLLRIPGKRRAKGAAGGPLVVSAINRCNVFNVVLSMIILLSVWQYLLPMHLASSAPPEKDDPVERLDPDLIDEIVWPSDTVRQLDVCAAVATYGPGGSNSSRALVLRKGAAAWKVTSRVTLHSLVRNYPDLMGTVTISPSPVFTLFTNSSQQKYADAHLTADQVPAKLENMPLTRFKSLLLPGRRRATPKLYYDREYYYWSGQPTTDFGHQPDQAPLKCFLQPSQVAKEELHITTARLRVTAKASIHVMHYDASPSLLVQLSGRKLVTLVPPKQLDWTYPFDHDHLMYRRSKIDLLKPDYEKYPLSKDITLTEVVMREGDIVIFPLQTPHQTRTLTDNVSMSFRFKDQVRWR